MDPVPQNFQLRLAARQAPGAATRPSLPTRWFTAHYKLGVVAGYDAAPAGEGAVLRREGLYSGHVTGGPRDAGSLAGLAGPGDGRRLIRGTRRSPGCRKRRPGWSRSWPGPASWWMSRQGFLASAGFTQDPAEVDQGDARAVPVAGLLADRDVCPAGGDGPREPADLLQGGAEPVQGPALVVPVAVPALMPSERPLAAPVT